jgi:hypothetical protein
MFLTFTLKNLPSDVAPAPRCFREADQGMFLPMRPRMPSDFRRRIFSAAYIIHISSRTDIEGGGPHISALISDCRAPSSFPMRKSGTLVLPSASSRLSNPRKSSEPCLPATQPFEFAWQALMVWIFCKDANGRRRCIRQDAQLGVPELSHLAGHQVYDTSFSEPCSERRCSSPPYLSPQVGAWLVSRP